MPPSAARAASGGRVPTLAGLSASPGVNRGLVLADTEPPPLWLLHAACCHGPLATCHQASRQGVRPQSCSEHAAHCRGPAGCPGRREHSAACCTSGAPAAVPQARIQARQADGDGAERVWQGRGGERMCCLDCHPRCLAEHLRAGAACCDCEGGLLSWVMPAVAPGLHAAATSGRRLGTRSGPTCSCSAWKRTSIPASMPAATSSR